MARSKPVAGATRDVTERIAAEELVESDRRRWRELLLNTPAAIAVLRTPEFRFEFVNDAYTELVGRSSELLLGNLLADTIPEAEYQGYVDLLRFVYRTGEPFVGREALLRMNHGLHEAEMYVNFVYLATRSVTGEIDGIFVHVTDVTDLVTARKRIEESEQRFRQLADFMPHMVWTARSDGTFDYFNERWYEYTGMDRALASASSWLSLLHVEDAKRVQDAWDHSLKTGEPLHCEFRMRDRHKNRWRWFLGRGVAVRDAHDAIAKWFGTATDIEEQKSAQLALLQTQKLESIGLLAGGIAHDFNNLLVGIMGGASFALETISPSNPAYPMLQNVVDASEQAAHLTRQMLAYAGKGKFLIEPIDLSHMALQTTRLVNASIPKSVHLKLELGEQLPRVEADSGQMQQVVMNLIINAAEAVGDQSGTVTVRTHSEVVPPSPARCGADGQVIAPGPYVILEVQDTGTGIDPSILGKIFDPFFTTKFTGRGLGLAAVSGITRSHHGALEVESVSGHGSTFRVLLPAVVTRSVKLNSKSPERAVRGRETVLVIDDEAVVRGVAKAALTRSGYQPLIAETGEQALEHIRQNPLISVVLLDMSMPGLSGRQLLEAVKKLRPSLPVVICSGYSADEVHRQFFGLEIADVLQKPFTSNQLNTQVRSVLDGTLR